jgi:hypothetical protein
LSALRCVWTIRMGPAVRLPHPAGSGARAIVDASAAAVLRELPDGAAGGWAAA